MNFCRFTANPFLFFNFTSNFPDMKHSRFVFFFIIVLLCLFSGCAKRGYITGGPIDSLPPVVLKSNPDNYSIHFDAKEIQIYFDEYVKLENVNQNLIISPPLNQTPEILPMGFASKMITVKIHDTLKTNTTYNFNFGQSIVDNNEGNPLGDFSYVFSTGDYIDSLKISGSIQDAYSKNTEKNVKIMLYPAENFNDSTVYKEKPLYVGNTLEKTTFELNNLKEGDYRIVALQDKNNNYLFDPKTDKIGFVEETVYLPQEEELLYQLSLFREEKAMNAYRPTMISQNKWLVPFEGNPKDVDLQVIADGNPIDTYIQKVKNADSLHVFTPLVAYDSLQFNFNGKEDYSKEFTVKPRKLNAIDSLAVNISKTGTIGFRDSIQLTVTTPLVQIDSTKFILINKDSASVPVTLNYDSLYFNLHVDFAKAENENYQLEILPGAMRDIYDKTNDSLLYKFKTTAHADYGNLTLNIVNPEQRFPLIVQLLDDKENILYVNYLSEGSQTNFALLPPKMYFVRVIIDENENGKWDTGDYLLKKQPEEVFYETEPIDVRANWEINETFTLE